jgi:hypothetical protein
MPRHRFRGVRGDRTAGDAITCRCDAAPAFSPPLGPRIALLSPFSTPDTCGTRCTGGTAPRRAAALNRARRRPRRRRLLRGVWQHAPRRPALCSGARGTLAARGCGAADMTRRVTGGGRTGTNGKRRRALGPPTGHRAESEPARRRGGRAPRRGAACIPRAPRPQMRGARGRRGPSGAGGGRGTAAPGKSRGAGARGGALPRAAGSPRQEGPPPRADSCGRRARRAAVEGGVFFRGGSLGPRRGPGRAGA